MRRILIVDGDPAVRATLREQLTRDGAYTVIEASSAGEAETRLTGSGGRFAAMIMDAALPDGDGHAVCARLRANGVTMPVILLNGQDRTNGANGTITIAKPFRLSELMARLRAGLEASEPAAAVPVQIGPFDFNPEDKALHHRADNLRIRLTEKEVAILAFLYRMSARAVPRRELLTEVWGYNPAVTTHTLETHIYRLRRKMETDPARAALLVTEAGGYRLAVG